MVFRTKILISLVSDTVGLIFIDMHEMDDGGSYMEGNQDGYGGEMNPHMGNQGMGQNFMPQNRAGMAPQPKKRDVIGDLIEQQYSVNRALDAISNACRLKKYVL